MVRQLINLALVEDAPAQLPEAYHTRRPTTQDRDRKRVARKKEYSQRRMIAWDGEGMKLSGDDSPQHYVLFGCSAEPNTPLIVRKPTGDLTFRELADYAIDVGQRHPGAFHVGYFFKYDQNMIIKSLPWRAKHVLYEKGAVSYRFGDVRYRVQYVPGKKLRLTRVIDDKRESILIEDIAAFWATSFVNAYCQTFPDWQDDDTFQKVIEGKKHRADMMWEDMPTVLTYWTHEIRALARLAESLKDMMTRSGFPLSQWYGPGAFANAIRRTFKLSLHEWGGKEQNLRPEVHSAIKAAFVGGHFEQYQMGRIRGPIYYADINSAYPAAFRTLPTMREGGRWERIPPSELLEDVSYGEVRNPLSVYHVEFDTKGRGAIGGGFIGGRRVMPLPHRSPKGEVTYPSTVNGWFWSPEVALVRDYCRNTDYLKITEGFRWIPADAQEYPWRDIIDPMFAKRLELKAANDPAQMVFKLGPNSLYGKMAQRVGWRDGKPPGSHTLCIAGYLTSWCRAQVMALILTAGGEQNCVAVETDGVYLTKDPRQFAGFPFSTKVGEWGLDIYDEVIYLQNGVYLTRSGKEWTAKTRGMAKNAVNEHTITAYLDMLVPGEQWKPLTVDNGEQFAGLGASIARSMNSKGQVNPFKANKIHCVWKKETKDIDIASQKGKRRHVASMCRECRQGKTLNDGPHILYVNSRAWLPEERESAPHTLPWEADAKEPLWRQRDAATADVLTE